jgi:four helix bundle protein
LVLDIYKVTLLFPADEKYNLISQLRRAAVSVPNNIVEGAGRFSKKEFIKFLIIARGSIEECKYLLLLSRDLNYINENIFLDLNLRYEELGKMINGLIRFNKKAAPPNNQATR